MRPGPLALTAGVAAAVTAGVLHAERDGRLPGAARWRRTNHAGAGVTLVEGLALAVGTTLPLLLADPPAAGAVAGAALAGIVDDLGDAAAAKGLRGHLGALRRGEVTTGTVKIAALLGSGLVGCLWSDRRVGAWSGWPTLVGAALVAGSANLANLLDLRPGRALKVGLVLGLPLALRGRPAAAAVCASGTVVLPPDLRGETMLGDTGANPLGAAVGLAATQVLGPRGRLAALAVVAGLTLLSERVSFSRVIGSTPVLRDLDRWGRPR
ncbi:hypothetical protein [Ornithinimicrobium avium]|uniref:UDP-N-acetylmuramyl pentapeptide phosphotransferase/UDP-N-acetylglucosamine-1-phosphate transferase n=1 Tax=Ornithinimicrobium avium TaxID=2283195 RepID=A0A345NJ57_9MICO|nr:hypothetical protein [Ornithinimicrobium avium]AXH95065.1 hypothetical protein DV701_01845 [Ornithinimicrobium avium]